MSTAAGIDIGSEGIKGIVLKAGSKGPVEVIGAGTMPINELTRMPESEDRALAIGEKLKELTKSARLRADTRRVGVAGGRTSIRYLQIPPVPPWRLLTRRRRTSDRPPSALRNTAPSRPT